MFIMMPSAFASARHENLAVVLVELEDKTQAGFEGAIDIVAAESVVGSYFVAVKASVFGVVVLLHDSANSCRYMAESIENKNQFDTFGQYSCFTLASPLASDR